MTGRIGLKNIDESKLKHRVEENIKRLRQEGNFLERKSKGEM